MVILLSMRVNSRFGYLIHALDRTSGNVKLLSLKLSLNVSKAVPCLVKDDNDSFSIDEKSFSFPLDLLSIRYTNALSMH